MKKVITYGTFDVLHYGHIKLLERAKQLGDYLIVGVTADDFDKYRGKINVQQSLMERIEAVQSTGLADQIIIEEYEGQKIEDIKRYAVDVFTVGSDWEGQFDYLKEFCDVVYLERTKGVSSSEIRTHNNELRLGLVGEIALVNKVARECSYVNGVRIEGVCSQNGIVLDDALFEGAFHTGDYSALLERVDAVYILSHPKRHYEQIKEALAKGLHVLCESPVTLSVSQFEELIQLAAEKKCVLREGIKTAYSTAYNRMMLLAKSGKIGDVVSVDAVCTSLRDLDYSDPVFLEHTWNSLSDWGPIGLLPVFQLLGTEYRQKSIVSRVGCEKEKFDEFTKIDFIYPGAVASVKVGKGVKSEGELIISGTKGYIYVPAPWWKNGYFEVRHENMEDNKRFFYQEEGEGIRNELVSFVKSVQGVGFSYVSDSVTKAICGVLEDYYDRKDLILL